MLSRTKTVAPALKAMLLDLFDYAGLFPPAALSLAEATENFRNYQNSDFSWMLRNFVLPAKHMEEAPHYLEGHISLLAGFDDERARVLETTTIVPATRPIYCEIDLSDEITLPSTLQKVKSADSFAKIRMGGLVPGAIPHSRLVAEFLIQAAALALPFKATAGLHHPFRAEHCLTYESNSTKALMHGFLNMIFASCLAWHRLADKAELIAVLDEKDPERFLFADDARCGDFVLSRAQISEARDNFFHSIGSCSFSEPIEDLQRYNWL